MDTPDWTIGSPAEDRPERLHTFAHGIKNKLGALWEALRMMRDGGPGAGSEELMAFAESAFFGAQRDIESLLDDMHVDRDIRVQEMAPLSLSETVREALARNVHRFTRKEQHTELHLRADAMVIGDAYWVLRIIDALLSNASKFSPPGTTIHVTVERTDDIGRVIVTDNGAGMTAEDLRLVFTRYAMLSSHTTDGEQQMRGTLARAKQWAEANGGALRASSPGKDLGSTFELRLALA